MCFGAQARAGAPACERVCSTRVRARACVRAFMCTRTAARMRVRVCALSWRRAARALADRRTETVVRGRLPSLVLTNQDRVSGSRAVRVRVSVTGVRGTPTLLHKSSSSSDVNLMMPVVPRRQSRRRSESRFSLSNVRVGRAGSHAGPAAQRSESHHWDTRAGPGHTSTALDIQV